LENRLDIHHGDVILVAQPNIPDTLVLIYALNKIGAVCNLVHPYTPFNQIKTIIDNTHTKYAFLFEQRVAKEVEKYRDIANMIYVTRIEDYLPLGKRFIYHNFMNKDIRKKLGRFRGSFKGFKYVKDLKPTGKGSSTAIKKDNEISILLHSGSTTGDPKTICLCDENFLFISDRAESILCMKPEDMVGRAFLTALPSFHGFGFCMSMHCPLVIGSGLILLPKYSAKESVKAMKKVNTMNINGVPTMFDNLLEYEGFHDKKIAKNLYVCFCGGDLMSDATKLKFDKAMADLGSDCKLFQGYGLTEAVAVNCLNTYKDNKLGSLGYPMPDVDFKILDEEGNDLGRNQLGEICLKSGAIMVGYYNDPEATKETMSNGYVRTGDLGYIDDDGFVFFTQRIKRVIKVSGVGIFPTEIERLVQHINGVKEACAISIPDKRMNHAIKLYVVADYFDRQEMINVIMDTCRKYLIRWAHPKEIEFIDALPRTLLGKVDFKTLQEQEDRKRGLIK